MKRILLALALAAAFTGMASAANEPVIALYSGVAPGSESWTWSEQSNLSERDKTLNIRNIVAPSLTVFRAEKPNGTAVLVIPGGGFVNLGFGKEGVDIARWYNAHGVTAFVLKYRLAQTGDEDAKDEAKRNARVEAVIPLAIADAEAAMRLIKSRAGEWGIRKLGVIGFSAGGLLAVATATSTPDVRPDFVVPVYAGVPNAMTVTAASPPAFIVLAEDDRYGTDWSLAIYKAWHTAHAPVELHIYARGNHGFALRQNGIPTDTWTERMADWLRLMGLLP
jgi:acetyl esterase/lipase